MHGYQFHPVVAAWFADRFGQPTEPQQLSWPLIHARRNVLIAAPTGSGKTLAAFLICIDRLLRLALDEQLPDATKIVYVSPLRALSNDIQRNLEEPLEQIAEYAERAGYARPRIRTAVRSGDTPSAARERMLRRPPHILVTTPESLFILLTSRRPREPLQQVDTVIVDEIHALARDKRGSHLSLTLERLAWNCEQPLQRIGISATQRPMDQIAAFLTGCDDRGKPVPCEIVDVGHLRDLDLAVETPPSPLSAVCPHETWAEIDARLGQHIDEHRSTLIFVNTRSLAERLSHRLRERLGQEAIASHHGSLSKRIRQDVEARLKSGQLKAIVATASLELGIDIGYVDLVCQIGSPRSIATLLQRVGRSGHALGKTPKGRVFPLTRDDLLECLALCRAIRRQRLDQVVMPVEPLDILAQQIIAACAVEDWQEADLHQGCRRAWPFRGLSREAFDELLELLSRSAGGRGRASAWLHRDLINGGVRARRGARIAAVTSGGAIPERADYRVVLEDDGTLVGSVDEDFAIEAMGGDVFVLGSTSWRIRNVRNNEVRVTDAQGAAPTIPFWLGEARGRSDELSLEVSELRRELSGRLADDPIPETGTWTPPAAVVDWVAAECGSDPHAAGQAVTYVRAQLAATGVVPTADRILVERFFDESGGMQLVIHSPYGSRINRAWGLALRKCFCRQFDFELQAAATENGVVLSLGPQHSFPLPSIFKMLKRDQARRLLVQAVLAVPIFLVRWRWNATRALLVLRMQNGKRIAPALQRFRADDLLTAVFPTATGCLENIVGDIPVPDHPLVQQTMTDCLQEAMDIAGLEAVLTRVESDAIAMLPHESREPSPFSHELLNANPYAFLDGAPLEERRTRAVQTRRTLGIEPSSDLGWLDPRAVEQVRSEAWPVVRDADELHDALLSLVVVTDGEIGPWSRWVPELQADGRVLHLTDRDVNSLWLATERWPIVRAVYPSAALDAAPRLPAALDLEVDSIAAMDQLLRGRMDSAGPTTADELGRLLGQPPPRIWAQLEAIEGDGTVLRGHFSGGAADAGDELATVEWCERRLLARIHRLTIDGLRRQIKPVSVHDYLRFLAEHQRLTPDSRGRDREDLLAIIAQLEGCELPAVLWEQEVLPMRLAEYDSEWLDQLTIYGEVVWGRLQRPRSLNRQAGLTRVVPISLSLRSDLHWLVSRPEGEAPSLHPEARQLFETLQTRGAMFSDELLNLTGQLRSRFEEALGELIALGLVSADGFAALRTLLDPKRKQVLHNRQRRGRPIVGGSIGRGGRWTLFPPEQYAPDIDATEEWAWLLLRRYGVAFRDLLSREPLAPPWYRLVVAYRQNEARGQLRGGRFIAGVGGEQFALPETVDQLRRIRDREPDDEWLVVSAADPINLYGVITDDQRVPAQPGSRLALRNGRCIGWHRGDQTSVVSSLPQEAQARLRSALGQIAVVRRQADTLENTGFESLTTRR